MNPWTWVFLAGVFAGAGGVLMLLALLAIYAMLTLKEHDQ